MMSKEAMKLALEALEHMLEDAKQERLTVEYWNECVDAITALREALAEQPAQQQPVAWYDSKTGSVWKTKADETDTPLYTKDQL